MPNSCWQHEWLLQLTHTHTRPACTLSSAVLNVGVLMLGKFLSRLVGKERCQADSCSNFTFPRMWSRIGNSGESQPRMDTHIHTHTHSEKHMYSEAHMHQLTITHVHTHTHRVGAEELERLDVTGLIIEGCPLKLLHTRAQKIKLSYQWAAHPKKRKKHSHLLFTFLFQSVLYLSLPPFSHAVFEKQVWSCVADWAGFSIIFGVIRNGLRTEEEREEKKGGDR